MENEQGCIKGLISGSYKDFTILYDFYASRLYAFTFSLSRSESIAKEIVQETFIQVWIHRKQIDPGLSFKSYLFTIAKNQLLKELRKEINRPVLIDDVRLLPVESLLAESVETALSIGEFRHSLEQAKGILTPRQREIFELNKEKGLSIAEIASKLSITPQSVRNQLSQALQQLRKEMGGFYRSLFGLFF